MKIIKGHYRMKQARPDVFAARNLNEDMRRNLRALVTCILPVRHNDSVIFFCKLRERSYGDFDLRCALAILMMFSEVAVFNGPPKSATFLIDGSGTSLKHIMKMKPNLLKMIAEYIQNYFPIRLGNVHILNTGFPTRMLFKMVLPFVKPEMAALIHLHSIGMDMETFYDQWIPKRCLPKEYGGELDSVEVYNRMCTEELESLQWFFDAELLQRTIPT
ncbi:hypothetical protein RI129_012556 [Pyrocoelia pectoralis]|uniref:CRAL-TRIO domain-containing protein n=1 Tax=Pyrocoelia pectoralis TaxID=417401 RepID=A0AAN7V317_9COLE